MPGPDLFCMDTVTDAQNRLQLVLRSQHGPRATAVWSGACSRAGVVCTGSLTLDELDRVTAVLVERGGADAVAARSCRVRLVPLGLGRTHRPALAVRDDDDVVLDDAAVRAALREPDALSEAAWRRRLAELEAGLEAA